MSGKPESKLQAKGQNIEQHFRDMRQKVHDYIETKKADHTIKKLLKQDPVAVLLAADIGFWSVEDVRDYIYWEITTTD